MLVCITQFLDIFARPGEPSIRMDVIARERATLRKRKFTQVLVDSTWRMIVLGELCTGNGEPSNIPIDSIT